MFPKMPPKIAKLRHYSLSQQKKCVKLCTVFIWARKKIIPSLFAGSYVFASLPQCPFPPSAKCPMFNYCCAYRLPFVIIDALVQCNVTSGHCPLPPNAKGPVMIYSSANMLPSFIFYSPVQCSAVQCSAVQCSAVQCRAVKGHLTRSPTLPMPSAQYPVLNYCCAQLLPSVNSGSLVTLPPLQLDCHVWLHLVATTTASHSTELYCTKLHSTAL